MHTDLFSQLSKLPCDSRVTALLITLHTTECLGESVLLVTQATDKLAQVFCSFRVIRNSLDDHAQLLVASLAQLFKLLLLGEYVLLSSLDLQGYLQGIHPALLVVL